MTTGSGSVNGVGERERRVGFATRAIHHAYDPADHARAASPPVFLTSTFAFQTVADIDAAAAKGGLLHAREHNRATELLEARQAIRPEARLVTGVGFDEGLE